MKKTVLLVLTEMWADWEAAYAIYGINFKEHFQVKTISADAKSKASMGGLRAEIDCTFGGYQDFENTAMIILPGGLAWKEGGHDGVVDFLRKARACGVPVAAICGATIFLGKHGFLDGIRHTGDDLELFTNEAGYNGREKYVKAQIAVDGGFITANETAALEFACEIWRALGVFTEEEIDWWYDMFKNGQVR